MTIITKPDRQAELVSKQQVSSDQSRPADGQAVSCNGHILNLYIHEQDCDNPACPGQGSEMPDQDAVAAWMPDGQARA